MSPPAAAKEPEQQKESLERRKARIEGIRKLIQQTSSNVRPEAESAAYRACALIRKFGLDVVDPSVLDEVYAENHRLQGLLALAKKGELPEEDDLDPWVKPYAFTPKAPKPSHAHSSSPAPSAFSSSFWNKQYAPPSPTPSYTVPPYSPPINPSVVTPPKGSSQPMAAPKIIQAKYNGKCRQCGKTYSIGDNILWMKLQQGQGVWCPTTTCYHDWNNKTQSTAQSAANFNPFGP